MYVRGLERIWNVEERRKSGRKSIMKWKDYSVWVWNGRIVEGKVE